MLIFLLLNLKMTVEPSKPFSFSMVIFRMLCIRNQHSLPVFLLEEEKLLGNLNQSSCVLTTRGKSPWKIVVASCALTARRKTPWQIDIVFLCSAQCKSKISLELAQVPVLQLKEKASPSKIGVLRFLCMLLLQEQKSPSKTGVACCALTARAKCPWKIDVVFLCLNCSWSFLQPWWS